MGLVDILLQIGEISSGAQDPPLDFAPREREAEKEDSEEEEVCFFRLTIARWW